MIKIPSKKNYPPFVKKVSSPKSSTPVTDKIYPFLLLAAMLAFASKQGMLIKKVTNKKINMKKIIIKKSKDGQFYFVVVSSNGQTLVTSETYTRKRNCFYGVTSLCNFFQEGHYPQIIDETKIKK